MKMDPSKKRILVSRSSMALLTHDDSREASGSKIKGTWPEQTRCWMFGHNTTTTATTTTTTTNSRRSTTNRKSKCSKPFWYVSESQKAGFTDSQHIDAISKILRIHDIHKIHKPPEGIGKFRNFKLIFFVVLQPFEISSGFFGSC